MTDKPIKHKLSLTLAKWPNWLRWLLVIPTAFLGSFLPSLLYDALAHVTGANRWVAALLAYCVGLICFVELGTAMAPRHKNVANVILIIPGAAAASFVIERMWRIGDKWATFHSNWRGGSWRGQIGGHEVYTWHVTSFDLTNYHVPAWYVATLLVLSLATLIVLAIARYRRMPRQDSPHACAACGLRRSSYAIATASSRIAASLGAPNNPNPDIIAP
jgi:hypothetical protein